MTCDDLPTLRRRWSSAKSAVKAAQKRYDFARDHLRLDSLQSAERRLDAAQQREWALRRRVEAAERAQAAALKETP